MRGRQRAADQPVHPIGTMLSGYSPFGGTPPPPQTHPAMAKIIIQPGMALEAKVRGPRIAKEKVHAPFWRPPILSL